MYDEIIITTYEELDGLVGSFNDGLFHFLVIVGDPGIGKSTILHDSFNGSWMNNYSTVLGLYKFVFDNKKVSLWFDDVDVIFENKQLVSLLKQVCETKNDKSICYETSWDLHSRLDVEDRFLFEGNVLITLNDLNVLKKNSFGAMVDRAIVVKFDPSPAELIRYIKEHLGAFDNTVAAYLYSQEKKFSIRDYVKTKQLVSAGLLNLDAFNIIKSTEDRALLQDKETMRLFNEVLMRPCTVAYLSDIFHLNKTMVQNRMKLLMFAGKVKEFINRKGVSEYHCSQGYSIKKYQKIKTDRGWEDITG